MDVKVLNRKKGSIKGKITRLYNYVNNEDELKDEIILNSKLSMIEKLKNNVEDLRNQYLEILEEKDLPEMEENLNDIEMDLESIEVSLLKFKTSILKNSVSNENVINGFNESSKVNIKLPDIPLPKFSGNLEDWHNFKVQFNSLITENDSLDDSHKLFYLKSALIGNARQIQTTEDSFHSLFKALQERYENKRLLVYTHINNILNLEKINHESATELRSLIDKLIKNIRSLKSLNLELDVLSENIIINIVLQKIDKESRKLFEMSLESSDLPKSQTLIDFLQKRVQFLENIQQNAVQIKNKTANKFKSLLLDSNNKSCCVICQSSNHPVYKCSEFLKCSAKERFHLTKKHNLCLKCFSRSHKVIKCNSMYSCKLCHKNHNTLLHLSSKAEENRNNNQSFDSNDVNEGERGISSVNDPDTQPPSETICASTKCLSENQILLATAIIFIRDAYGNKQPLRFLCDSGSMINALSSNAVKLLRLKEQKMNMIISGLNEAIIPVKAKVIVELSNLNHDFVRNSEFIIVPKITDITPPKQININLSNLNKTIKLADSEFYKPGKIDGLIGAQLFFDMLRSRKLKIKNSQLILQESAFGFLVSGSTATPGFNDKPYCGFLSDPININETLSAFWEIEAVKDSCNNLSEEEAECEKHFLETYTRASDGRYIVKMPLKTDKSLGKSKHIAASRLESLYRRLSRDSKMQSLYTEFIREYRELGHMEEASEEGDDGDHYYLPHHGVYRPEKSSTKLRVVFNGSVVTSSGVSLNQLQKVGKIPQQDLFSIMLRFRKHACAFTADIRMMYRQILIHPSQRNLLKILWKEDPTQPVKTYKLSTVTYGTASAPYLATRVLKQLCDDEENEFPEAATIARTDFYMDDILSGAQDLEGAKSLKSQLVQLLDRAKMSLHKWASNSEDLLNNSSNEQYSFNDSKDRKSVKALGVLWNPHLDCFSYKVTIQQRNIYTKRTVLSDISRIFDPLGLIGPVVTKAKIFMQSLWLLPLDWDEPLPESSEQLWLEFISQLPSIENLCIPRYFSNNGSVILHGFADASSSAYGASVYAQYISSNGDISVHLLCSKSRVAPVKSITIPRLELCGALLLSQLIQKVISALEFKDCPVILWSDSTIVLAWLKKSPHELKTFVSNRVSSIQELTKDIQWKHVKSNDNPSDLISRGLSPNQIQDQKLWWHGPAFLSKHFDLKDTDAIELSTNISDYTCELKQLVNLNFVTVNHNPVFSHLMSITNDYCKLISILSFTFRFLHNARNPNVRKTGPIGLDEVRKTELFLLKQVQGEVFNDEIKGLQVKNAIKSTSKLKSLNPFLDSDGILRVGGRLKNTEFGFVKKHPAILPKGHKFTILIINYFHKKYLHVGPSNLLNHVREKFWPIGGRAICRKIVHECQTCFKSKPIISSQLMGDLPKDRVIMDFPFNCSGVDLCGPFTIKIGKFRKPTFQKVYICLFICFVFKAVHIEIVSDLTSESFIAALKRFVARRGKCAKLYSDNATNFVGANKEIKKIHELIKKPNEKLAGYLCSEGIQWKFIPPRSPNFGGLWEAAIKSFKYHFKRVVGNANLTYEELLTVVVQIEGILNSRPLSPLSASEDDFGVLTPAHFLINRSINSIIEPDLTNLKENRLKKWQKISKIVQVLWRKWHRNYLSELQQRNKWRFEKDNVRIGDLVLTVEENLPVNKWHLGRIVNVYYGEDRKVRVVQIKTRSGTFKRSISKIALLPMPE